MKKNVRMTCFAAIFCLGMASYAYASQINAPGSSAPFGNAGAAGGYNAPGAAAGNNAQGYAAPNALPGNNTTNTMPGNNTTNTMPGNNTTNTMPGNNTTNTMPGNNTTNTLPGNNTTNTLPGNNTTNTLPGNNTTNTLPGNNNTTNTLPGNNTTNTLPGNTAPNNMAPNTRPGYNAPNTLPGYNNPNTRPGYNAPNTNSTQPRNAMPGTANPNSPYGNGSNLPGTSNANPAVGGVTNDPQNPASGQTQSGQANEQGMNHQAGRTRPLLKATPVPGKIDVYNVHPHDTLWIIAQKYKIKLDAVIDANPELPDPDAIYPGDQIKVPLDPNINDTLDIGGANTDKGDGKTMIRSNVVQGRYSGAQQPQPQECAEEKELLDLVNNERAKAGLPSVNTSGALSTAARIKADEMSAKKYFNHTSPVYGSPFEMLRAFGVSYKTAGENIAKGQKTAKAVLGAWMNSEGHRANILNPDFKEIGIGYANDGETTYWVQVFTGK